MGRLPKKKPETSEIPPMTTRSSQRLQKIRSEIRGEVTVIEEKKTVNIKVKSLKAVKSNLPKKPKADANVPESSIAQNGNHVEKASEKMDIEVDIRQQSPALNVTVKKLDQPQANLQKPSYLKPKQKITKTLVNELEDDDDFEEILTKKTPQQTSDVKPQLNNIKTPPVPKKHPINLVQPTNRYNSDQNHERKQSIDEDDDMEAMLCSADKKNIKIPDEPELSINPSMSNYSMPPDPMTTPVAGKRVKHHIDFRHEDFVAESKKKVEDTYYFIKPPLGNGMFGTVYKAKHKKTGVLRAIKRIKKDLRTAKSLDALLKDVEILKTLDHPNIIKVYEYFQDESAIYIVTELCTGGELFECILKEKNFNEKKAAELMRQMLSAIAYCHEKKLAHCDLKPENIMLESQAGNNLIKVIDFGSSSFCQEGDKLTNRFGSLYYVAPEVLMSSYTEKCDVWSLGVIMYLILSGKPPFNGATDQIILKKVYEGKFSMDSQEWESISEDAKDLIRQMLTYDFKKRVTAKECLQHKWIKEVGKVEDYKLTLPIGRRSLRNLKTFKAESKMQEAIMYFIVNQLMNKDEKEDLMNAFMSLDTDHDGKLTKEDLVKAYVKMGEDPVSVNKLVDEILNNIDKSDKGFIDYTEYMTASLSKRRMFSEDRLIAAFELFDEKGQGYITVDDFKSLLNRGAFAQVDESLWIGLINDVTSDSDRMDFDSFKKMVGLFTQNEQITQSLALT
jgi:calcium-dependent protein kinase